ncbi:MAG: class I SAM-dependent methyltransferase [Nitrospiraceae bacterium]|nr:class I SAM-dependent methyltransferase [Nitrospiraceae bacterium]
MQKTMIREGWDNASRGYRDGLGFQLRPIAVGVAKLLPESLAGPVVDLACGPGTVLFYLSEKCGDIKGIGCDFSFEMGKLARERNPGSRAVVADQDCLPFRSASLGAVVSSMGTIFSSDHAAQLKMISRLLMNGGFLAFSAWGEKKDCALRRVSDEVTRKWPHLIAEAVPSLDSPFSFGESGWIKNAATEAGLELLKVESGDLVFDFPGLAEAADSLVHTGRFALLLKDHSEWKELLTELTREHFIPYRENTGRVRLSNRFHLFLLRKKAMGTLSGESLFPVEGK